MFSTSIKYAKNRILAEYFKSAPGSIHTGTHSIFRHSGSFGGSGGTCVRESSLPGWICPDTGFLKTMVAPDTGAITRELMRKADLTLHIVGGFWSHYAPVILSARRKYGFRCGVVAEGVNLAGYPGIMSRVLYTWKFLQYRRALDFILAMGENGVNWYRKTGWPATKVFPFAYVTAPPSPLNPVIHTHETTMLKRSACSSSGN